MVNAASFQFYCTGFAVSHKPIQGDSMRDLKELEDVVLIDMLAQYTQRFTQLFRNFTEKDPDYQSCKDVLMEVTVELDRRRGQKEQTLNLNLEHDGQTAPV
jgi:hypothetical protein